MAVVNRRRKFDLDIEQAFSSSQQIIKKWGHGTSVQHPTIQDLEAAAAFRLHGEEKSIKEGFRTLAMRMCGQHPVISTQEPVLGGAPHIKGTRVSVTHILAHLHHLGSIDAIVEEFSQRINTEQVKEALAYAHDFMEMACDPSEDDD